ncbi:MAG TPA: nitronate monooxygenase family protein [Rhizomicrobium sp.]|jgi:nitronate monooxygenase|nr:nitronate monooxygenase family protein [Rhizomicrobium sp.]
MPWPDHRILDLFNLRLPIVQAPMANFGTVELAIGAGEAGALASLPGAALSPDQIRAGVAAIRKAGAGPVNLNFFCHKQPALNEEREVAWRTRLLPYYREMGIDPQAQISAASRKPFDEAACALVEELRPEVVSFHFGLPDDAFRARVKAAGAKMIASATVVAEARWLEEQGCDAVIAMGAEAGGHRGNFLSHDMARQVGTFALVPQIVDAVRVPVIATGGIADGRGIAAALALGASAVQIGTAYLFCPEAKVSAAHRAALAEASDDDTEVTNLFTGRPARGIVNRLMHELGPLSPDLPAFPLAAGALAPLKAKAEAEGSGDFSNLWSGQGARITARLTASLARPMSARELTLHLAEDAKKRLAALSGKV